MKTKTKFSQLFDNSSPISCSYLTLSHISQQQFHNRQELTGIVPTIPIISQYLLTRPHIITQLPKCSQGNDNHYFEDINLVIFQVINNEN